MPEYIGHGIYLLTESGNMKGLEVMMGIFAARINM